ncbi:MAG TPA: hypothetical protein ENG86_03170 [Nitrospirae bacterium]|nr:hypothetical protein [Nitrospirota bacterium]
MDDTRATLKDSRFKTTVNRAYYAVLNTARSLLVLEGSNPEAHEGDVIMSL